MILFIIQHIICSVTSYLTILRMHWMEMLQAEKNWIHMTKLPVTNPDANLTDNALD